MLVRNSLLPSVGWKNEYQPSDWVMLINGDGWYGLLAAYVGGPAAPRVGWLGPKVGSHLAPFLCSLTEPTELSQWLCYDSTVNIVVVIIIIIIKCLLSLIGHLQTINKVNCCVFSAMHIAWRERNKDARIKAAKEILEKNPEFVYLSFFSPFRHIWRLFLSCCYW